VIHMADNWTKVTLTSTYVPKSQHIHKIRDIISSFLSLNKTEMIWWHLKIGLNVIILLLKYQYTIKCMSNILPYYKFCGKY